MTRPIYAIGDVHGQKSQLEDALALIERDGGGAAPVVFVGDYADRGADTAGVLDLLIQGRDAGRDWTFLKGNHDRMFEWFMEPEPRHDPYLLTDYYWLHARLGGRETLASYGVDAAPRRRLKDVHADARDRVPQSHLDFLRGLRLSHQNEDFFFVHAGIRPGVALDSQTEEDMLWIRSGFIDHAQMHPKLIVHGHTAVDMPEHQGNRVNLDGGAGYGRPLVPAVFEAGEAWTLGRNGRTPLTPQPVRPD
ncbi:MAG: metallophosphoesterase [Rhodobacteraceae bacterium]|nr:metallophosphoesterase [Paracoccaceae bacterium]